MALILVIANDPATRMEQACALSRVPEATVVAMGTAAEARRAVEHTRPRLVVLNLRPADYSGLDLLQRLASQKTPPTQLVLSAFPQSLPRTAQDAANITIVPSPVAPEELCCRVLEALQLDRPPSLFTPAEYLQMACLGGHSLVLLVTAGRTTGFVAVRNGDVWAAGFGDLQGMEACYAAINQTGCAVEVRPWPGHMPQRQVTASYQELLFEAALRYDERERGRSVPPRPGRIRSASPRPPEAGRGRLPHGQERARASTAAADLVAQGVRAVIDGDYATAVTLLEQARSLNPEDAGIRHRLERLNELGYQSGKANGSQAPAPRESAKTRTGPAASRRPT